MEVNDVLDFHDAQRNQSSRLKNERNLQGQITVLERQVEFLMHTVLNLALALSPLTLAEKSGDIRSTITKRQFLDALTSALGDVALHDEL